MHSSKQEETKEQRILLQTVLAEPLIPVIYDEVTPMQVHFFVLMYYQKVLDFSHALSNPSLNSLCTWVPQISEYHRTRLPDN